MDCVRARYDVPYHKAFPGYATASAVSAIERGDLSELQHVLEESDWDIGSEPLDSKGQTALHIACANGHLDIVQYLVENVKSDENDSEKRMATGLLLSLTNKKCNVAEYLLSKTSEHFPYYAKEVIHSNELIPQLENEILLVSCAMGHFEVVKFLFKVVSGNVLDDYIQSAYANEHWDILMYLKVKKGDSDFSDVSPPHLTPLQLEVAWRNERFEAAIALLELTQKRGAHLSLGLSPTGISQLVETVHSAKGAYDAARGLKIKTKVIKFEEYVMKIAYSKEYAEVFKFLCTTHQTEIDRFLKTIPLCCKSLRIVQYLIKHKISVNMSDVHVACIMGDVKKLKVALESNGPSILCIADPYGNLAIHYAVYEPRVLITILGAIGNDLQILNANNDSGESPLYHCISSCCMESLDLLIKVPSCDLNLSNYKGETPLHIACIKVNISAIQLLVADERCDLNIPNSNGDTPLHIAACSKSESAQMMQCLLQSGRCDCNLTNRQHCTPLHVACKEMSIRGVEVLVADEGCDLNIPDGNGDTPLHIAACSRSNNIEMAQVMLKSGRCDLNVTNKKQHYTPIHVACKNGIVPLVKLLLKNGGNILQTSNDAKYGDAPIHIACKHYQLTVLKALLSHMECDPNQQNAWGDTALHTVCKMAHSKMPYFEALISTPGINFKIANHEGLVPFQIVDSDGDTLFHTACSEGSPIRTLEFLLKNGADVLKPNRVGDAPIHIACKHYQLTVLKALLSHTECDPNQQNAWGDTALHILCKMVRSKMPYFETLISAPGINFKIANHEGLVPFEVVDSNGDTLFHTACSKGNSTTVEYLLKNGADILKCNGVGDAPIHIACIKSKPEVLKLLLECRNCNPNQQNASGDTALHIVCKSTFSLQLVKTLISTPGIDPEIVNHNGLTPIEEAGTNYATIDAIKKFLAHKKSSLQGYLKVFVVGNSGTGKSTLIKAVTTEASQLLKFAPLSKMKYVNPSDVPPHTAGIVPISFNSKHFGNAVLYDFAGQHEYYSSHAAVMENLILPSPPLFLLLIDISKSKDDIREELVYWWHFINNQSQKAAAPPHVILAGSHKDMVKSGDKEELDTMIRDCIKRIPVTFEFVDYFSVDCRKLVSRGLSALLTQLNSTCQTLRDIVDVNLHCHILRAFLATPEFQGSVYCKAVDIMNRIESDDAPLPKIFSQLIPLLASLNDQGHILLLQNHTNESESWVILKPDVLLTEVNGSVFAPEYLKEHSQFAMSTGVVTSTKLKERFTEHNHEVIVTYLTHLEFCFRINDQHTLDMITKNAVHESAAPDDYYFFPALVHVENPTDVGQPNQSIGYECGWLYKCSKELEQLTTRFLHVLILRLAFSCKPPDNPTETESVVLLRKCSVWKHGIAWWTNDGIEVIVEVGLQCRWVAVMLRCPDVKKVECAELRSKVIHTVLKTKTDFCPAVTMKEYLIAPSSLKYPFEGRELTVYSLREVAEAAIEGKDYATDTEGKNPITIPELLPFEPYHNMRDLVQKFFSGDTSVAVTSEELTRIAVKCHKNLAELNTAFKPDVVSFQRKCKKADCTEVERCVALFHILQRRGRFKTWRDFQQEFSRFSIFCEQGLLVRIMSKKGVLIKSLQVNIKFRKFERKYRDCIKRKGDKIGTQTCHNISTYPCYNIST